MDRASVVETHISVLFFVGDRVYKVRKKITTPFLDFSTRELRRADCRREVELNRRLAPDVYLGVLDLVDGSGAPVEHVVLMRRLPADRRLSSMIASPEFDPDAIRRVARQLAVFHASADRSAAIDQSGSVEHLTMLWSTTLDETEPFCRSILDPTEHALIRQRSMAYLSGRHSLIAGRVRDGRIVDGHGDLLAEDIFVLDDGPRILDCIEFDPTFRWGDVLYDTSFLAMDLEHLGRLDLARSFLDTYREFTAESHPASLEHWYIAYRALVRAKIACLRSAGGDDTARPEAQAFLAQSDRHLAVGQVRLVLVGGLPGAGKSTVARGVADRLGADLLATDTLRKELAHMDHSEHAYSAPFEGLYAPARTAAVYRALLERARIALEGGDCVVLDASWLDATHRGAAESLAVRTHATLVELCCTVDMREAEERLRARAAHGADPSDATPEVLTALAQRTTVPWPGAVVIDTGRSEHEAIEHAIQAVGC